MRFLLKIESSSLQKVPINYQYPLSAWIYKTFASADAEFSNWLHEHGYAFNGNRKFKLFTFSQLQLRGAQFEMRPNPVLSVPPGCHQLLLSFYMEEAAQHFISGLFAGRTLTVADRDNKAEFVITSVECLPNPDIKTTDLFQCISPLVLSQGKMTEGKLRATYLSPNENEYGHYLKENLIKKYVAAHSDVVATSETGGFVQNYYTNLPFDPDEWSFKLMGTPKSKLLTIKAGTPQQSKIRGYLFKFQLTAARELMTTGYQAGFGEKSSLGMGMVELINRKKDAIAHYN